MRELTELFTALSNSAFRQRFRLGPVEHRCLSEKGLGVITAHARNFIQDRLAPARPKNDGRQNADAGPSGVYRSTCHGNLLPILSGEMARHCEGGVSE